MVNNLYVLWILSLRSVLMALPPLQQGYFNTMFWFLEESDNSHRGCWAVPSKIRKLAWPERSRVFCGSTILLRPFSFTGLFSSAHSITSPSSYLKWVSKFMQTSLTVSFHQSCERPGHRVTEPIRVCVRISGNLCSFLTGPVLLSPSSVFSR